jgi:hypothetical protein
MVRTLVNRLRKESKDPIIDPTSVGDITGWTQNDYRSAWAQIIRAFAQRVLFVDGWQFSNGCAYEYLVAVQAGIPTLDEERAPIDIVKAANLLRAAISELSSLDVDAEFLRATLAQLTLLSPAEHGLRLDDSDWQPSRGPLFKDAVLDRLARHGNVAQFVSFSPSREQRFARLLRHEANAKFPSVRAAISALIESSEEHSVNIRTYQPKNPRSREFVYGLSSVESVIAKLNAFADQGLYTIVNETIDVHDGGVSGVNFADVIEFAPDDTPRCVEKPGVASLPKAAALAILERVYRLTPNLPVGNLRVEFSLHPLPRGFRAEHTVLWEAEPTLGAHVVATLQWPNRFSRFLGDKTFGLLLADAYGWFVPMTSVVCRRVAPFTFGRSTGHGDVWIRTSPAEPVPGRFTTRRGWLDPFALLNAEDPDGTSIASVLAQEGVRAEHSGALIDSGDGGRPIVEGVVGNGVEFMLGNTPPTPLPPALRSTLLGLHEEIAVKLGAGLKFEWVFDGERVWIVQLNRVKRSMPRTQIVAGERRKMERFDVRRGLEEFRAFLNGVNASTQGVILEGEVGSTSHFGDLLREAGIPSFIEPLATIGD